MIQLQIIKYVWQSDRRQWELAADRKSYCQAHTEFDIGFGESLDGFLQGESLIDLESVGQPGVLKRINSTVEWYGFDGSNNIEKYVGKPVNIFSNVSDTSYQTCAGLI